MTTIIGFAAGFLLVLIGIIQLLKFVLDRNSERLIAQNAQTDGKKHKAVDISQYQGLIRNIGFIFSLAVVLLIFEWRTYEEPQIMQLTKAGVGEVEILDIPATEQTPPPPPSQTQNVRITAVEDEIELEELTVSLDMEIDQETEIEEATVAISSQIVEEEVEEVVEQIYTFVEEPAEPHGGMNEFLREISAQLQYPKDARKLGIEGKVFVQFVVDKTGKLTDIQVARGIGHGCDEEAMRVIKTSQKWKPGKQRGRAVKQQMILPIMFVLHKRSS